MRISQDLIDWLDAEADRLTMTLGPGQGIRGRVSRTMLVEEALEEKRARAVEQASSEAKEPWPIEQADPGSVPSPEGVRSATPAEPASHRSSAAVKQHINPIQKAGKA